jgi:two-component system chemotaxis response regulator CheY
MMKNKKIEIKPRILIVEDDAATRGLMQILLAEYGDCTFADNGQEGIDVFTQALESGEPFELVCLDIMMPEMDGLEALKRMRLAEQGHSISAVDGVKVIMVTTANQQAKTMRAFHYGCNGYLVKPISKDALIKEMNKLPLRRSANAQWRGR